MTKECIVYGCSNTVLAKSMCRTHYLRMRKTGTLECSVTRIKTGDRFGRLVVQFRATEHHPHRWSCRCNCGNISEVMTGNLSSGHTKSCGCLAVEIASTHGLSRTTEYRTWINIHTRCNDPTTRYWPLYGGRGIKVCARWSKFEHFLHDMGKKPYTRASIDRIDVNGNYEPGNCRWTDSKTQGRNRRCNRIVSFDGRKMTLAEAVENTGLNYSTVLHRILNGWDPERALSTEVQAK
jgi:hypothetical protein